MPPRLRFPRVTAILVALAVVGCAPDGGDEASRAGAGSPSGPGTVHITATDFEFDAPEAIPSGWTTIRFENAGEQEHFVYLYRLPDDVTYTEFRTEAMGPFARVWNRYASGELSRSEAGEALGSEMPGWFFTGVTAAGGAALTEPGETSRTTVRLEPGTYVMECYVKTPKGTWHTERGMQTELTVTAESNGAAPPEADVEVTLSNYAVAAPDSVEAGERTFAVRVEESPEGFNAHDLNLFRLEGATSVDSVVAWMDWMDLDQFRAPAPGYSLGGVDQLAAGRTGYATVELTPGRYAWVSEGYGARGVVHEFTVE